MKSVTRGTIAFVVAILLAWPANSAQAQIFPEQRSLRVRGPARLPRVRMPASPPPATVSQPQPEIEPRRLPLDEAIRIALVNAQVVRILSGVSAVSSGRTIYDAPIANTAIDVESARFDPRIQVDNSWNQLEQPQGVFDFNDPAGARIAGARSDDHRLGAAVVKDNVLGGQARVGVDTNASRFGPGFFPLNPQDSASADMSYTQPLLQGGGFRANVAPIVLARIDTERSYFQFKDAVQEQVRGVIDAYWALVAARLAVWVGERQVEQADFAFRLADALFRNGFTSGADRAQARVTRANFQASLVTARADAIQREAALRNILGLPPADPTLLVPVTPPADQRLEPDWYALVELAEERRPDLIELKLIVEADRQLLIQARNLALPRADAVALYRWNGLEGRTPSGAEIGTGDGDFADWTLGVNFSVPLGRRQGRADVRRVELLLARDRAELRQGLHAATHVLATNLRALDQVYEQYLAFSETRDAAEANLDQQLAAYRIGTVNFLNVVQAITDWGNAINNQASSLAQYNVQLAGLERETGTILESHGIVLAEERAGFVGPLHFWRDDVCYPARVRPLPDVADRYPTTDQPSESYFELDVPASRAPPADISEESLPPTRPNRPSTPGLQR